MLYRYFNRIEAAEYLGISRNALRKLEEEYKIEYFGSRWDGDRCIYFAQHVLDKYLNKRSDANCVYDNHHSFF